MINDGMEWGSAGRGGRLDELNMQVADVPGVAEVNGALDWACCPLRDHGVLPGKRNI